MNANSTLESICELLHQAQEETQAVLTIDGSTRIVEMNDPCRPRTHREARLEMDRYIREATWRTTGPGYERLREWVETHWRTERGKPLPSGTVATTDDWQAQSERQLDFATATKKLITAARLYGSDRVGKCADEFAAHGMIEVHWCYLLKGPRLETAKALDDYCTVLPYGEALRRIEEETDPGDTTIEWPEPDADNLCALQVRYFDSPNGRGGNGGRFTSPLLRSGSQALVHLLGLVWGCGFRVLGTWHGVPAAAEAALPYRLSRGPGASTLPVALATKGYGPSPLKRPLAVDEMQALANGYSDLSEPARPRVDGAMVRLRNSSERFEVEDKVIVIAIALKTFFREGGAPNDGDALVPPRAAWLYADSSDERWETEAMLVSFFARYSEVVSGLPFGVSGDGDPEQSAKLLAEAENVLRTSLKMLVAEGWLEDWSQAIEPSALRRHPPRTESEIPSVKSDSLSWTVKEQREIDRALEAVWRPVIEEASPPPNMSPTIVPEALAGPCGALPRAGDPLCRHAPCAALHGPSQVAQYTVRPSRRTDGLLLRKRRGAAHEAMEASCPAEGTRSVGNADRRRPVSPGPP